MNRFACLEKLRAWRKCLHGTAKVAMLVDVLTRPSNYQTITIICYLQKWRPRKNCVDAITKNVFSPACLKRTWVAHVYNTFACLEKWRAWRNCLHMPAWHGEVRHAARHPRLPARHSLASKRTNTNAVIVVKTRLSRLIHNKKHMKI